MSVAFIPHELQGNILRGYRRSMVRYLLLEVTDRGAARIWLGAIAAREGADGLSITTESAWSSKPDFCFNIGLTFEGLRALGVAPASLQTFPTEFVEGMTARAAKLGDFGASDPQTWPAPFDEPARLHIIASIYADDEPHLDQVQAHIAAAGGGRALRIRGTREGRNFNGDVVHFGYRDNISQPRFAVIHDRPEISEPMAPLGTVLLGHETSFEGLFWRVPQPDPLGLNGCFNAFRILAQDVAAFETYLDQAAEELLLHPLTEQVLKPGDEAKFGQGISRLAALREIVAAHMCGRWRNGVPLALSPDTPNPQPPVSLTDFDYTAQSACPVGAHVRRSNPRGGKIVQRIENHTRRLVRRGIPYGGPYDPTRPDDEERGLLGNFLGANLGTQFEAISCDWLNLGLQDPQITGSNDPLLGANEPATSWFDISLPNAASIRLRGFPRFVRTRGGAYTFLPSIPALRYLATLTG